MSTACSSKKAVLFNLSGSSFRFLRHDSGNDVDHGSRSSMKHMSFHQCVLVSPLIDIQDMDIL